MTKNLKRILFNLKFFSESLIKGPLETSNSLLIIMLSFSFNIMDFIRVLYVQIQNTRKFLKLCQFKSLYSYNCFMVAMALKEVLMYSEFLLSVVCGFSKKPVLLYCKGTRGSQWSQEPRYSCQNTEQMRALSEFIYRILSATDQLLNIYAQKVWGTQKRFLWRLLYNSCFLKFAQF